MHAKIKVILAALQHAVCLSKRAAVESKEVGAYVKARAFSPEFGLRVITASWSMM